MSSFHPDASIDAAIRTIRAQCAGVVLVDDGSPSDAAVATVLSAVAEHDVEVVRLPENRGIAAALNVGVRFALEHGADAVVTFDQDSVVGEGFVAQLVQTAEDAARSGVAIGAVVPEYFADVRQTALVTPTGLQHARKVIQSGMLVPKTTFDNLGMFREDLFIDLVDLEYEWRMRDAGLAVLAAPGVSLAHSLGAQYAPKLLGVRAPFRVTLSTPFRYYYRYRNRLVVDADYPAQRSRRDTLTDLAHFAMAWMLASRRAIFARLLRAAHRDARASRLGPMPKDLQSDARQVSWRAERVR